MAHLKLFSALDISRNTSFRSGEIKFGERLQILEQTEEWAKELTKQDSKYAILGIPEDIGVRANMGRAGAAGAWSSFIKSFLNIQHNRFCKAHRITLIGHLDFEKELEEVANLNIDNKEDKKKMFELVDRIDKEVAHTISIIVKAKKIPIIIGGGHNNSYGNIKGTALGKGKCINAINFDAHTDFRALEGRHSGNGFSYALEEGFLKNYFIFGLHENYTSKSVFSSMKEKQDQVKFNTYEQMQVRKEKSFETELITAQKHVDNNAFGIEIDLDAIPLIASSAITPTGFSAEQLRQFIYFFAKSRNAAYLHICEGAPSLDSDKNPNLIGKFISYLVTDFIKANSEKII
ncbi:formimidoylglutamase [Myroides guanonis]|uniref:Formiminoglutamase n=1 Tax=Myroides guanonis TaxID=1150112 RepID=A0A1I3LAC4_9FLAO|nr:formimidoylglutamase [Myroides guanonis]SFI81698.1 formiminoglutamase [Myroides guanonis]